MRELKRLWLCLLLAACLTLCACEGASSPAFAGGAPKGKWIHIDVTRKRLTLYEGGTALTTYAVATGTRSTPTPIGTFVINSRFSSELSGFGTRFLGLNVPWGQFGIHGTNKPYSIGQNASHGCVRMYVGDAERLYAAVPNGTRVVIEGGSYGLLDQYLKPLAPGDRGSHVRALQERLRQLGYHAGSCDGIYGRATERAVKAARADLGLRAGENADSALYQAIGLILFE